MNKVSWRFYGGIGTIGGTIIEITYSKHRILFDMGRAFNPARPVFDDVLKERGISDLQRMGTAPSIPGLFEGDGSETGLKTMVLISHSHLDHTGLLPYLRTDVPVLLHNDTHRLLECLDEVLDGPRRGLDYRPAAQKETVKFGPFNITLVEVDHDTPGACGFLIETPEMKFVYSGDLRLHGAHSERTEGFVEAARSFKPDVLFIEGTRVQDADNSNILSERSIEQTLLQKLAERRRGIYFTYYPRHPERLNAFKTVAARMGRRLLVQGPHAYIYEKMGGDLTGCGIYRGTDNQWPEALQTWIRRRGLPVLTPADVRSREEEYLTNFDYDRFRDWLDIDVASGALFVHSNGSPLGPFDPAWENMTVWLHHLGIEFAAVGSTGHGSRGDILSIIERIDPRVLMPIHSLNPEKIGSVSVARLMPEYNRKYSADNLESAAKPSLKGLEV